MLQKQIKELRGSLTARVFMITALILAAACGITYAFIVWTTPITFTSIVKNDLEIRSVRLLNDLEQTVLKDSGPILERFMIETGAEVVVLNAEGREIDLPVSEGISGILRDNPNISVTASIPNSPGDKLDTATTQASSVEVMSPDSDNAISITRDSSSYPFTFRGSANPYTLTVFSGLTVVNRTKQALTQVWPYLALVVLAISLLGAMFYSRHITKPIVRISAISQKMADLNFSWRCQENRTDEIGVLGRNLDELSNRLSSALAELQTANAALHEQLDRKMKLERQRMTFFSAASHELKTPITILKGQISGMLAGVDIYRNRDKYLLRSLAVTNRMEGLVGEMLEISRLENTGFTLKREAVDLSSLILSQAEQAAELAEQKEQTLEVQVAPGLAVQGDTALLGRSVANLITNAIFYSPKGASISVSLSAEDSLPVLIVKNSDASIPENDLPHLFEAFYRVESSRNRGSGGNGLGLHITKIILDRHGAKCRIKNSDNSVEVIVTFNYSSIQSTS
ncbi:sensor histidine kinase [Paenibacillus sp. HW567]|uniref:sensor histidine kinase n=1 Tax=Paenibacillus sp. HW567 TaxID=1034769 RepID=UPI000378D085|nr:HAMP domain-containing sensor histidine kinase [Paenibacillus sp. HW567]